MELLHSVGSLTSLFPSPACVSFERHQARLPPFVGIVTTPCVQRTNNPFKRTVGKVFSSIANNIVIEFRVVHLRKLVYFNGVGMMPTASPIGHSALLGQYEELQRSA